MRILNRYHRLLLSDDPLKLLAEIDPTSEDAKSKDPSGRSLLSSAILEGLTDIAKFLIVSAVELEEGDKKGWTPLHYTAYKNDLEIASLLLESNVSIDTRDKFGNTPLWRACFEENFDIANFLFKSGADPNVKNNHGISAADLAEQFGVSKFLFI